MISKQYFSETSSLETAQALQEWANNNLIIQGVGDYGMKISFNGNVSMFAETEVTGLTIGNEYTLSTNSIEVVSNIFRTKINALPNDNTSTVVEMGYGTGTRNLLFTATAETMYIAIGDENSGAGIYSVVDNISLKIDGVEAVSNGTFEAGNTTGWYAQTTGAAILEAYSYVSEPPAVGDNPYIQSINIPVYNASDTSHVRIPTDEPFTADTFNNDEFKHFYIEAGTHTGRPEIAESGTSIAFKTISPLVANTHPAQLPDNERSKVSLKFTNSDYWVVSGLCDNGEQYFGWGEYGNFQLGNNTSNIILDQLYFNDFNIPINIKYYTDSHTVQKCYFDEPASVMLTLDQSCIQVIDNSNSYDMRPCTNHKLILNDFKNYKPMRLENVYQNVDAVDYSGLVVDSNSAWYDETSWCDSDGTPNTEGEYSLIESGWGGVKAASRDINNPVIYSNNTMTGAKEIYPQAEDPLSPGSGGSFATVYYDSQYVNQYGNVLSNCSAGVVLTSRSGSIETTLCRMEYNIMHNCGSDNSAKCPIMFQTAGESTVRYNVVKDCIDDWATMYSLNGEGNYFGNNDVINTSFTFYDTYSSTSVDGLATNNDMTTAQGDAKYTHDYTITTHRYTSPQTTVVSNVLQMTQEEFIQSIWNMS